MCLVTSNRKPKVLTVSKIVYVLRKRVEMQLGGNLTVFYVSPFNGRKIRGKTYSRFDGNSNIIYQQLNVLMVAETIPNDIYSFPIEFSSYYNGKGKLINSGFFHSSGDILALKKVNEHRPGDRILKAEIPAGSLYHSGYHIHIGNELDGTRGYVGNYLILLEEVE